MLVGRQRGVDVAAGQVEAVARLELDVEQRLGALGHEVRAGLRPGTAAAAAAPARARSSACGR